jgi:ABC-type phosphate transport system substrate-binding protein
MVRLTKLLAGATTMAAVAALVAGTVTTASAAPNDPPKGVVPKNYDIVGVGSGTTEFVFDQFSQDYNKTISAKEHSAAHPWLYSWDATKPGSTSTTPTDITPKAGFKAIVRPNGSSPGLKALETAQKIGKYYADDFARSSSGRSTAPSSVTYVEFAKDAVTWSTRTAAHGGTDAPTTLTLAQLKGIFTCVTTNWKTVDGRSGAIKVYLPQAGSGTLSTWEKVLGITKLGKCVSQAPEENEGTFAGFNSPNAVFIYSIGAYVSQKYHKNAFGTNVTGFLGINKISGTSPITSAKVPTINPKFPSAFFRILYNIVRGTKSISDPRLTAIFGPKGWICKNATAQKDIVDYGFLTVGSACGSFH